MLSTFVPVAALSLCARKWVITTTTEMSEKSMYVIWVYVFFKTLLRYVVTGSVYVHIMV